MSSATVVTIFHPTNDSAAFVEWVDRLRASAPNAVEVLASVVGEPYLDWGVAARFADEQALHEWLDSPVRQRLIEDGRHRGILCATSDLVISDDGVPPGVGVFRHAVVPGREAEFVAAEAQLAEASSRFGGFEGCCTFAPTAGADSLSVLRFRTEAQLATWLASPERIEALRALRLSLSREFSLVSSTTAFGATVRTENGRTAVTPKWKTAMLILLVLYPTVMLLSRFLGPMLSHADAPPWLAMWLSQVVSVAALQWVLMPWAGRRFRLWLDPVDGAGTRNSALGAAVLVVGYVATLSLFAAVRWLQYWDYGRS